MISEKIIGHDLEGKCCDLSDSISEPLPVGNLADLLIFPGGQR